MSEMFPTEKVKDMEDEPPVNIDPKLCVQRY